MSEPHPAPVLPKWLSRSVVTLLALQVGLLWVHGSLLQRQHDDLMALREDVQALADSLDQGQDEWDSNGIEPNPARWAGHRNHRTARAAYLRAEEPEGDQALTELKKDMDQTRKSERDAVAKARDTQEKMSIQANIQKAEDKARAQAETASWMPWVWGAAAVSVVSLLVRALFRRRG
jgi:ribosomal protein S21